MQHHQASEQRQKQHMCIRTDPSEQQSRQRNNRPETKSDQPVDKIRHRDLAQIGNITGLIDQ